MKQPNSAFEKFALPYLDTVYRTAMALCGRAAEADDLTQTTFVKAMENFGSFKTGSNAKAWLLTILRHAWIDELRRRKTRRVSSLPIDENTVEQPPQAEESVWTDSQDLLENFSDEQVIEALKQLPDDQRLTLFLIDVEGFTQEETAQITGTAPGTVKSRTSRARNNVKQQLAKYASGMGYRKGQA